MKKPSERKSPTLPAQDTGVRGDLSFCFVPSSLLDIHLGTFSLSPAVWADSYPLSSQLSVENNQVNLVPRSLKKELCSLALPGDPQPNNRMIPSDGDKFLNQMVSRFSGQPFQDDRWEGWHTKDTFDFKK